MLTTNQGNAVVSNERYYAYGRTRYGGIGVTDQRFTGPKRDSTGLQYFNARYYDPELGQFLSPDTLVPDPGNLFDYNRYMYTRGNPMKYNDPTGHCATLDNGDADWEGDHDCWALAYQIYGYGLTSQQFAEDWQVSPDAWLNNVAKASFADVNYLTPFFQKYQTISDARTGQTQGVPNPVTNQDQAFEQFMRNVECDNPIACVTNTLDGVSAGGAGVAALCTFFTGGVCAVVAGPATAVSIIAGGLGVSWTAYQVTQGNGTENDLAVTGSTFTIGAARSIGSKTLERVNAGIGLAASLFQWYYDNHPPTYPSTIAHQ